MSEERNGKPDWRTIMVSGAIVIGGWLVQWGITSATLAEHSRRLEMLERRMEDRTLTRDEFEKRHAEVERRLSELERKERAR